MLSCHDKVPTGFVFVQKFKTETFICRMMYGSGDKKPGGCAGDAVLFELKWNAVL